MTHAQLVDEGRHQFDLALARGIDDGRYRLHVDTDDPTHTRMLPGPAFEVIAPRSWFEERIDHIIRSAKDRLGNYRAGQKVAEVHVDPDSGPLVTIRAPQEAEGSTVRPWRPTALRERVSTALEVSVEPLSFRAIDERVNGKAKHKRVALRCLIDAGHVTTTPGPRNAILHSLVSRYDQRADPLSCLCREPGHAQPPDDRVTVSVSLQRDAGHTLNRVRDTVGTHTGHSRIPGREARMPARREGGRNLCAPASSALPPGSESPPRSDLRPQEPPA